jgi:hypothetical protein
MKMLSFSYRTGDDGRLGEPPAIGRFFVFEGTLTRLKEPPEVMFFQSMRTGI